MGILSEIVGELKDSFEGAMDDGPELQTITVAKPYCTPARYLITAACQKYGIRIYKYSERTKFMAIKDFMRRMQVEIREGENLQYGPWAAPGFLAMAQVAKVTVSQKQAGWAEYILLRTGKLYVPGEYVNPRNQEWAERHKGVMPPAWHEDKPWVEQGCSEGVDQWRYLRKITKPANRR